MLYVSRHNQLNVKYTVNTNNGRVLNYAFVDYPCPFDDVVTTITCLNMYVYIIMVRHILCLNNKII